MTPVVAALILAACHSQPAATVTVAPPRPAGPAQGIDLPTDASDVLNELKDGRLAFVARYYRDPGSRWPTLSAGEAQRLSSLGLKIVAVWEWHSRHAEDFTYEAGYSDAASAYGQAKILGQPAGTAIYFAVDYDALILDPVHEYFRGVTAGLAGASGGNPDYKIGVYGSGLVCDAIKRAGLAQYTWLTSSTAWAGSLEYEGWNIRQGSRFEELSFNHDSDEARDDYGGFRLADDTATARDTAAPPADEAALGAPRRGLWAAGTMDSP
jgi:hypothetical protein